MENLLIFLFLVLIAVSLSQCNNEGEDAVKVKPKHYRVRTNSPGVRPRAQTTNYSTLNSQDLDNDTTAVYYTPTIASRAMQIPEDFEHNQATEDHFQLHENVGGWGSSHGNRGSNQQQNQKSKYSNSNSIHYQNHATLPSAAPRYSDENNKLGNLAGNQGLLGSNAADLNQLNALYASGGYPYGPYSNPILEGLYEREMRERERLAREILASRIQQNAVPSPSLLQAASSLFGSGVLPPMDFDDALALGSGHGGWGWKKEDHYTSKVDTKAIGLLGLLGLLSLLSNVLLLLTTTTTTTVAARKKRDISYDPQESENDKRGRIFTEVLPFLAPIAHARNGVVPVNCTFHGICMMNRIIVKEYGLQGRPAGNMVTKAIAGILTAIKSKENLTETIETAGLKGRNQNDCQKEYPVCKQMNKLEGPHAIPFVVKMEEVPDLLKKFQKLSASHNFNPLKL